MESGFKASRAGNQGTRNEPRRQELKAEASAAPHFREDRFLSLSAGNITAKCNESNNPQKIARFRAPTAHHFELSA